MNIKKIILPAMGSIAVATPLVTLVACAESKSITKEWLVENDLKWNDRTLYNSLSSLEKTDLSTFPIRGMDVFEKVVNSKLQGMLDVVRLQDIVGTALNPGSFAIFNSMLDPNVKPNGNPQLGITDMTVSGPYTLQYTFENTNAFWSKHIKKADIVSKDSLENISNEIGKLIKDNPTLKLGCLVSDDKKDEKLVDQDKYDGGEYTIYVYALKNNAATSLVNKAETLFKDTTKFAIDEDRIKTFGGIYSIGQAYNHTFSGDSTNSRNFWDDKVTIMSKVGTSDDALSANVHMDRVEEDSMKAWFGFGPIDTSKIPQSTKDEYKNLKVVAYPMLDAKTKEWYLMFSAYVLGTSTPPFTGFPMPGNNVDEFSSFKIQMPQLNNFASNEIYTDAEASHLLVESISFKKIFSIVKTLNKDELNDYANSAKAFVIDMFKETPYMYRALPLLEDLSFVKDLLANIKSIDASFDMPTFLHILKWMDGKEMYGFTTWGAKRMSMITMLPRFYQDLEVFVSKNPSYVARLHSLNGGNK